MEVVTTYNEPLESSFLSGNYTFFQTGRVSSAGPNAMR